jgi:transcriptional regulator with XRE-family HTH domain
MSDLRKSVGNRIRDIRKAKGLTQQQLAEQSNLDDAYIGAVERGERNFSIDTLEKIVNALEIQSMELFPVKHSLSAVTIARQKAKDEFAAMIDNLSKERIEAILRINEELCRALK